MLERNFVKIEFILSFETLNSISNMRQAAISNNFIAKIAVNNFWSIWEGSRVTLLVRFTFGPHEFVRSGYRTKFRSHVIRNHIHTFLNLTVYENGRSWNQKLSGKSAKISSSKKRSRTASSNDKSANILVIVHCCLNFKTCSVFKVSFEISF